MRVNIFRVAVLLIIIVAVSKIVTGARKKMDDHYFIGEDRKLEVAIIADDCPTIAKALTQGANVNARGVQGITPLMLAVDMLKKSAVAELLARGAKPNDKAEDGNSAVSLAIENYRQSPDIFFAIMKAGGNPDIRRPDNDPVIIRFMNDCNCDYIRYMKSFGADLDIHTREDDPIITDAGLTGDWDVVWCLIELGGRYDYESTAREPLSLTLAAVFPRPDSPIYPYKKKVWQFLHDRGIKLQPLK
jgi:uncharacterized protein